MITELEKQLERLQTVKEFCHSEFWGELCDIAEQQLEPMLRHKPTDGLDAIISVYTQNCLARGLGVLNAIPRAVQAKIDILQDQLQEEREV